jgi:hypothetical protein
MNYFVYVKQEEIVFLIMVNEKCIKRNKVNLNFSALNRPQMRDADMNEIIGTIVDSLFSVCVTLGMKLNFIY